MLQSSGPHRGMFSHSSRSLLLCLGLLACLPETVFGQAPVISSTFPQAVRPGAPTDLKIRGGNLAGATQLWTSFAAESTLPADIMGNGMNAAEVTYRVTVPADANPGLQAIRVATPLGISSMMLLLVDDLPSVAQTKPNQQTAQAMALTLPVGVDAQVDSLQRDFYKFTAAAGQRLAFEVWGQRLGAAIDPMLRVLDAKGREIAFVDDTPGVGSDCQLEHVFKEAGDYLLEVRDVRFQGGPTFRYRLRAGDFPLVTAPYPMAVKKGASASLSFAGKNGLTAAQTAITVPADFGNEWMNIAARGPGGSGLALLAVSAVDEPVEAEPNNEAAQATRVNLPAGLNGRFDQPGDVDRFVFTGKAGTAWRFQGFTRTQGSPTDLVLRIIKPDGAEAGMADDNGSDEGQLDFTIPADGDYTLVVEDLQRRGGPEFVYRVIATPLAVRPKFAASAETVNIPAGGLGTVIITATRFNFAGPIQFSLAGAPEGMVATPVVMGPGRNQVTMTIACQPTVAAGKVYPVKIIGKTLQGTEEVQVTADVVNASKAVFAGMPYPPSPLSEAFAIGVTPAALFTLGTSAPEIVFGKDLSATVKVATNRTANFAEEIAIALLPAQDGIPAGVTAAVKPIAKGTNEVEIAFSANAQAPLGQFSVVLVGTGKAGNITSVQPIPALLLTLKSPFELKAEIPNSTIAKGQTVKIKVVATRNPAYNGPITLTFQNLPKGVTAAAAMIPAGQNEVELDLTAAADAAAGAVPNVIVQGTGMNGNAKVTAASGNTALTVP